MGFAGRLEGIAPSDIFQIISQSRMTGTLIARCPDGTAMVVFKNGQVIEAASDAPQESLGHLLVSQGVMTARTIEAAQELRKQEPDRPLGAILVDMGVISGQALEVVVRQQIGRIVHRLISCDDGFITFDRGEVALKRKLNTREFILPSGISPEYLIMERARSMDEDRRHGGDRRAPHAGAPPSAGRREPGPGAAVHRPAAWVLRIKHLSMADVRDAAGSAVRKGRELVLSARDVVRRSVAPRLEAARAWLRTFSPDGRALIIAGLAGTAAGIALILLFTLSFGTAQGDLVVTGKVVNIRAKPAINAKVVAKAVQGEPLSPVSTREGWHQVKTRTGATGWVAERLVGQNVRKGVSYNVKGFELVLIAGIALLITGVVRWRRMSSAGPRVVREVR